MTKKDIEKAANDEQSSTSAPTTPTLRDLMTIRRPRPGSVVILAPAGTPVSVSSSAEYKKIVLLEIPSE